MVTEATARHAYSVVGELVLIASALDSQLNKICIATLDLKASVLLEPAIGSIDSARKIEILKTYASKLKAAGWKKGIIKHAEAVENINRWRNIAAHSVISFHRGRVALISPAAAKLLRSIDIASKSASKVDLEDLEQAIRRAEAALGSGENLLKNLERVNQERDRRRSK